MLIKGFLQVAYNQVKKKILCNPTRLRTCILRVLNANQLRECLLRHCKKKKINTKGLITNCPLVNNACLSLHYIKAKLIAQPPKITFFFTQREKCESSPSASNRVTTREQVTAATKENLYAG